MLHPALVALIDAVPAIAVVLIGLGIFAALAVFVIGVTRQLNLGKDRDHACDQ